MFRISLFKKIGFGAFTGTCLVVLSIIIVVIRISFFDYKPLPLLNSSKYSSPRDYKSEMTISNGGVRRKNSIEKDSLAHNHNDNDSYPGLDRRHSKNEFSEHTSSNKKEVIQNKDAIYNKENSSIIETRQPILILSDLAIARLIVAASIADYNSPCACPYQRTPTGKSCINRSTYARGSGQICYVTDVTPKMIQKYRSAH